MSSKNLNLNYKYKEINDMKHIKFENNEIQVESNNEYFKKEEHTKEDPNNFDINVPTGIDAEYSENVEDNNIHYDEIFCIFSNKQNPSEELRKSLS